MRVLVVYYSRTGTTRRVAERLARVLQGHATAIGDTRPRQGFMGYQRSLFEAVTGRSAAIQPLRKDLRDYDLVVVGTPVWGWHLSSPVRTFAREHAREIRRTAFFCTMGGSGDRRAFAELRTLLGRRPEAVLALTSAEAGRMDTEAVRTKTAAFARRLLRSRDDVGHTRPPFAASRSDDAPARRAAHGSG